jgi:hypothetical protein
MRMNDERCSDTAVCAKKRQNGAGELRPFWWVAAVWLAFEFENRRDDVCLDDDGEDDDEGRRIESVKGGEKKEEGGGAWPM